LIRHLHAPLELRHLRLLLAADDVLHGDSEGGIHAGDVYRLHLDEVGQPALKSSLYGHLQSRSQGVVDGREDESVEAAAEVGTIDALAWRRKENLFDELPDVIVVGRFRGSAAAIELEWIGDLHQLPFTRTWVTAMISGVPVGAQIAWLSRRTTGTPPAVTRVAAVTHCAVTQGPLPPGGTKAHPATVYGAACVATGCPPTVTRGNGEVGSA
jgi:hypothetical protein